MIMPLTDQSTSLLRSRVRPMRLTTMLVGVLSSAAAWGAFPDSMSAPPGWTGLKFKLSQAYPTALPTSAADTAKPWLAFDFKQPTQAPQYMQAVLDYCMEGNVDLTSPQKSFSDISTNSVRGWYHAPWLHPGREFMHGMTNERKSQAKQLGPAQTTPQTNWAVGFYNPLGGHTLGQVWKNETAPDPAKAQFPQGTVSCKLLFTNAPFSAAGFRLEILSLDQEGQRRITDHQHFIVREISFQHASAAFAGSSTTSAWRHSTDRGQGVWRPDPHSSAPVRINGVVRAANDRGKRAALRGARREICRPTDKHLCRRRGLGQRWAV